MRSFLFRPPFFLLTGFFWLILASLLGLVLLFGMIRGTPLPSMLRLVHVHGALIGGVAQIILGVMLAFIPSLLMTGRSRPPSHPALFFLFNGGAIAVLVGFGLGSYRMVGLAGLAVVLAFLALFVEALRQTRSSLIAPSLNLWFYGIALLALLGGLGMGEAMALRLAPQWIMGQIRLAHIHLNLLGFVTLTIVGTMHDLFPTVLNARLYSPLLAKLTFFNLPAGVVLLVTGFLLSQLWLEIIAGAGLLTGTLLYSYNIFRTWIAAGRPLHIAAEHLLLATFFLLLTIPAGILVAVNSLWNPPVVPFGTLHLIAYTHLALIGFVLNTIFGALSHLLPISLAVGRVASNKRRGPYLARLTAIVERWRMIQVGTLSLGTVGLTLIAALVWQFSLHSLPVQAASWISTGLLFLGMSIFAGKVGLLLVSQPYQ
jgi:hypothetical protein